MDKKEAIAVLERIKRDSESIIEIEALDVGIVEIQLTIDNQ